ncbi:MAG: 1,4-dihydroxy-2-naphthoate polyprenyltransferase [Gemmatimonadota bacterium]|nr:1,4-dihydroxy-2-naphthoate polyprenyltransferase [Gemmatimonadota bacterium]
MAAMVDDLENLRLEDSTWRVWTLAIRPKTLSAAVAPVLIAAGLAAMNDAFVLLPVVAAFAGAIFIQIGTNLANDYYDHFLGADTHERVGPLRVTQFGLIPPNRVWWGMMVALAIASMIGVYLIKVGGWPILWIGLASLVSAVAYTGGPYPLAYHGLGDLFVFTFFGLVAVGGTYWVQTLSLPGEVLLAGSGIGALSTAILVANNLRDLESDALVGKRTLAVRLGRTGSRMEYVLLLAVGFSTPALGVALFGWPPTSLIALLAAFAALTPMTLIMTRDQGQDLIPALPGTARLVGLYGLLLAMGLALG